MKEAFEKMTGMPDAWTNPALMVSRNAFIQGWEARAQHDVDATIIKYHEATIKRLEKRIEELAQPARKDFLDEVDTVKKFVGDVKANFLDEVNRAQPAQEPVGVFCEDDDIGYVRLIPHQQMKLKAWDKLYTTPQQRPWVGLTDEDQFNLVHAMNKNDWHAIQMMDAIEAKLKEKNSD